MLALVGAVLFLIAAVINLVHDPIQLDDVLKLIGLTLLAVQLAELVRHTWNRLALPALVAAVLFAIAFVLELTSYPAFWDVLLTTLGFLLVALFLAGVGPRTSRRL
jgi:hypothetical protein